MRKTIGMWAAALLMLTVLAACDKHVHDNERGLAVALKWQDTADEGTTVGDIRLWIYNEAGHAVGKYHFTDAREVAGQLFPLQAGRYTVVGALNLTSPLTSNAEGSNVERLLFAPDGSGAELSHAWYGVAQVTVAAEGISSTEVELRRMLSELTINITGAPEGTTLTGQVEGTATGVYPAVKTADGYGQPSATCSVTELPKTEAHEGSLQIAALPLMPTAAGLSGASVKLQLTSAEGQVQHCTLEAPPMEMAGKYVLDVAYDDLRASMRLSVHTISDWVKGWTIEMEITDPAN